MGALQPDQPDKDDWTDYAFYAFFVLLLVFAVIASKYLCWGVSHYHSLRDRALEAFRGFLELKAKAYNQHTATVVALVLKAKAQPKQRPKQSSHNKTIKTEQTLKKVWGQF